MYWGESHWQYEWGGRNSGGSAHIDGENAIYNEINDDEVLTALSTDEEVYDSIVDHATFKFKVMQRYMDVAESIQHSLIQLMSKHLNGFFTPSQWLNESYSTLTLMEFLY